MEEMETGPTLLLAMPQMTDPNFNRSVILLCRHDDEGALGFVINRPMRIDVAELLEGDFTLPEKVLLTAWEGGPVSPERGWLICREAPLLAESDEEEFLEVCQGIYMSSSQAHLRNILSRESSDGDVDRSRLLLGYAGWGPGQLEAELIASAWLQIPVDNTLIFETEADEVWDKGIRSLGVDPLSIAPGPGLH
ncbi:MAG: YqgE/AlgH family protein [Candidatus Binatia bacterium]|jgi:putative transcriptional regulator|nr:YqgE/AlgH family protein [Candidatus Binatia bacterium]MDG1399672.1 YqgE/AlgH family protein [Candidatus Binatia bacterium]MDG1959510.1 YqgE/AlgH family protein [Candidatus Binatia bacterium]MDG2010429.1 YqgE/AlgH family protein [Candidatus Binatia bacterium]HAC81830.1 hypothetical protein [Deltaproteobacteria bacterium]